MKYTLKNRSFFAFLLVICLLSGCGEPVQEPKAVSEVPESYIGMTGDGPELKLDIPEMKPGVLVDQVGYETGCTKVVLFRGEQLGSEFHVIDAETGSTVYTGEIENCGRDAETGEGMSTGSFDGLVESGNYYIQTAVIGESYFFSIKDDLYQELFRSVCAGYEERWYINTAYSKADLAEDTRAIANLLIAYEYYTALFKDDTGISDSGNGIPDILDLIRHRIEAVMTLDISSLNVQQLAKYSGILAKCAQDYRGIDRIFSGQVLAAAQEGYRLMERLGAKEQREPDESFSFFAAAELYRATGYYSYHTVVKNYLKAEQSGGQMDFYGKIAYLSSTYSVDSSLCSGIMKELMEEAEKISTVAQKDVYLVCARNGEEICDQMLRMAAVNYVITNHEYVTVQQNHLHYLLGRNPEGVSFIADAGDIQASNNDMITNDSEETSALIFMMCEIVLAEMED